MLFIFIIFIFLFLILKPLLIKNQDKIIIDDPKYNKTHIYVVKGFAYQNVKRFVIFDKILLK